jgi:pimeloyl-ACP methyl ester carboxylesterase
MTVVPTWFGPASQPRMGWLHRPADGLVSGGVVICPAAGNEYVSSHRALSLLAGRLEHAGLAAFRFDYAGTGDSAGFLTDVRVGDWLDSVVDAVELLRASGVSRIAIVGLRLGATVAASVAARCGPLESLVLWDPCVSGDRFLREQRALYAVSVGGSDERTDGSVEIPGVIYPPEFAEELKNLELTSADLTQIGPASAAQLSADPSPQPPVQPAPTPAGGLPDEAILVLTRMGVTPPRPLRELTERPGIGSQAVEGQPDLLDRPSFRARVPLPVIDLIAGYLSQRLGGERLPITMTPRTVAQVGCGESGIPIQERIVSLGPNELFGIVTEFRDSTGPFVLCLNVATNHHVGPARLWVELGRGWAAEGLRSVRFDMRGLGESGVADQADPPLAYTAETAQDVVDVARALNPGKRDELAIVGLCSGAWSAAIASLTVVPRAVYLVSAVVWTRHPRPMLPSQLSVPASAQQLLTSSWLDAGLKDKLKARMPQPLWRLIGRLGLAQVPDTILGPLVAKSQVTLMLGGLDGQRFATQHGRHAMERLMRTGRMRFIEVPEADHSVENSVGRAIVGEQLARLVVSDLRTSVPALSSNARN